MFFPQVYVHHVTGWWQVLLIDAFPGYLITPITTLPQCLHFCLRVRTMFPAADLRRPQASHRLKSRNRLPASESSDREDIRQGISQPSTFILPPQHQPWLIGKDGVSTLNAELNDHKSNIPDRAQASRLLQMTDSTAKPPSCSTSPRAVSPVLHTAMPFSITFWPLLS